MRLIYSRSDSCTPDLRQLDISLRNEVQNIADIKVSIFPRPSILPFTSTAQNAFTEQCIGTLRRISILNNDMVQIPQTLANLQASFRSKNSFSHIQRLHNMLYAYGATVIEIVRRKEFGEFKD